MPDGNIFSDLIPASNAPGVIYGPPKVPDPVDPLDRRSKELDVTLKEQRVAKGDPLTEGEAKLREGEQNAAFLATNMVSGLNSLNQAVSADPGAAAPTVGQEVAGLFGQTARNFASDAQRQIAYSAQRTIVDAMLTLGTGAAYTPEQIDAYTRGYFPQLGDAPETIADKRNKLRAAMIAARVKAGNAAPQIDKAMAQLGLDVEGGFNAAGATPPGTEPPPIGPPAETTNRAQQSEADAGMIDMTAEQKAAYNAFWKANPDPTPEKLGQFFVQIGAAPEGTALSNASAIIEAVKEGAGYSTALDRTLVLRAEIERQKNIQGQLGNITVTGIGPAADSDSGTLAGTGQTLGLDDEASGLGRAASRLLQGRDPIEGYKLGRDAERLRRDDIRRQMGLTGTVLEVGGGLLSANPTGALSALTGRQLVREGARGGALGGAIAGYGSGEGFGGSVTGAAVGATVGGVVGGALGGAAGRYTPRGMDPEIAAAAQAENVRLSQPMVEGNQRAINRAGVLESDPATAQTIQRGFRNTAEDIEGATIRLGRGGNAAPEEEVGEVVQRGARQFIQRSRGVADRLYNRARSLAGNTQITPRDSLTQLREELRQLAETPNVNQGEIAFINELGEDISSGPLSVEAVRNLRTSIRGRITQQGLTSSQADARAMRIMDALQRDAQSSLPPAAAQAFRRADAYYRERMVHIDDVLDRFIGGENGIAKLSGQQAFDKIRTMANKDGRRLAGIMRDLSQQERLDVAATLANSLGRSADDSAFQLQKFLDHTAKLSPSARRTVFGPDGAESINRLRQLTMRLQDTQRQVNSSKTARPLTTTIRNAARTLVLGLMGGGVGAGSTTAMVTAGVAGAAMGASAARNALSARALMNPRVANWLAQAADVNTPAQAQQAVRRLGVVIAREPALANELQPIQAYLTQAVTAPARSETPGGDNEQG